MKKISLFNNIILARNSHRPEIKLLQSVMVELLSGLYGACGFSPKIPNRRSIAQISTFRLYSVGCLLGSGARPGAGALNKFSIINSTFKNTTLSPRLFSTRGAGNNRISNL